MTERAVKVVDKLWERPNLLYEVMIELGLRRPFVLSDWMPEGTAEKGRLIWRRWREAANGGKESFVILEGPQGEQTNWTWAGRIHDPDTHNEVFSAHSESLKQAAARLDGHLVGLGYRFPPDVPIIPDVSPWRKDMGSEVDPHIYRKVHDGRLAEIYWDGDGFTGRIGMGRGEEIQHIYGSDMAALAVRIDDELRVRGFEVGATRMPDDLQDWMP